MSGELRHCSHAVGCQGPHLVTDHASSCPDGKMEDCDNDQCWVPCPHCITDEAEDAVRQQTLKTLAGHVVEHQPTVAAAVTATK